MPGNSIRVIKPPRKASSPHPPLVPEWGRLTAEEEEQEQVEERVDVARWPGPGVNCH